MVNFSVRFNKSNRNYLPGEEVICTWQVVLSSAKKMRSMYVRYRGEAETKWTETRTVQRNGKSHTEHVHYRGYQNFFTFYQTLFGVKDGPEQTLQAGAYTYETKFKTPSELPQTFEGSYGGVRYDVKINMDIKFGFDEKLKEVFYIGPHYDLNDYRYLQAAENDAEDKTFGCCCWESDPLKIVTKLPRKGFVPGETIKFHVEVNNDSDVNIETMEVKLKEKINFFSHTPSHKSRTSERELWRHDFIQDRALVQKLQKKLFPVEIKLNPNMEFKYLHGCSIIHAEYFIKVNAIPGGCHSRLSNTTGITIGTIPFDNLPAVEETTPLAPYPMPSPSAPNADYASAPPAGTVIKEQPLPNYHDAVYNPPKPSVMTPPLATDTIGWAINNGSDMPPPSFEESEKLRQSAMETN